MGHAIPPQVIQVRSLSVSRARQDAKHFLTEEKQFHLGVLPTEQSHPKTVGLAEALQKDARAGVEILQSVDEDVVSACGEVFSGKPFAKLTASLQKAMQDGKRICFSGCGATGRLSIMLEAAWRRFWQDLSQSHPSISAKLPDLENSVCSIMTGGDYALVKSVEFFEDYMSFGRRQVIEAKLGADDVLVAISEGGETSSVIGTIRQAQEKGATVFFVYNNPSHILARHVERSRQVIEDSEVTKLALFSGPMAVAGSTRMQATTFELLAVGAALEIALAGVLKRHLSTDELLAINISEQEPQSYRELFSALLADLSSPDAIDAIGRMVEYEQSIYAGKGLVTYMANDYLLDIFTDTTERTPTFMLPPFCKCDDLESPQSWAFVKNPLLPTPQAWQQVLGRAPRCLGWDTPTYEQLEAPAHIQQNPPKLGKTEIMKFLIGSEDSPLRYEEPDSAAILVMVGAEISDFSASQHPFLVACEKLADNFTQTATLCIGSDELRTGCALQRFHIPCNLPASPLKLWDHMAIKLVLNTVSTATMGRMGRLISNWMAHVGTTNKKLVDRGCRLISELAEVTYEEACYALHETFEELKRLPKSEGKTVSPVKYTIERLIRARNELLRCNNEAPTDENGQIRRGAGRGE
jgi:N-acetylmuramic acid 6-phosphate etherase